MSLKFQGALSKPKNIEVEKGAGADVQLQGVPLAEFSM